MRAVEIYGAILFGIIVFTTSYGRTTVESSEARQRDANSEEFHAEPITVLKDNSDSTNLYRLDLADTSEELEPFGSYQFEKKVLPTPNKNVNINNTASKKPTFSTTRAPSTSSTPKPISSTTLNPEEDETDIVLSTTPFKVDSLGNVVKINNTDESSEEQCDEGEVKRVKCNTCVCTDGVFFCSKKECPQNDFEENDEVDHQRFDIFNDDAAVQEIMNKVTVFGTVSQHGIIQASGSGAKNKWSWKKKQAINPLPDCTNGMTKTIDCNNCLCANGKWACTKTSCIALTLREKASYTDGSIIKKVDALKENPQLDEDCIEGSTRQDNCNQCVCHSYTWSCTNNRCPSTAPTVEIKEIEEACQLEGDVKSKECNICKCKRGIWQCSTNNCMVFGVAKIPLGPPKFRNGVTRPKSI